MKAFFQQLLSLWRQLGMNQRVSIIAAAAVVAVGMVGLLVWSNKPSLQLLYGRLAEKDMAEVVSAVQAAGVKYEMGAGGTSIYVQADQVHKLRAAMASKGIPSGEGIGFEVFDKPNFGISDFVQRTNYTRALQGELARTISQLNGVRSARVLIVVPENRLLFTDVKAKPTASVFVEGNVAADGVNSIRFLVANAVEGLRADDVAVVDHRGNVLTEGMKEDPQLGGASSQMKLRKSVEDYFTQKVETMLAKVVGAGNAVVRVSAELETESTTRTEERYDPDGQVLRSETTTEDSTITNETEGKNGGVTGASANVPAGGADPKSAQQGNGKNSEQQKKNKSLNYEINRVTMNSVRAPGTVARVSAAVFVTPKAQPRTAAELESLRRMVINALGIKAQDEKELAKIVTVEEAAFQAPPEEKASLAEMATSYGDMAKNAGAIVAAAALFFVFLRMLKKAKPDEIPLELLDPTRAEPAASPKSEGEVTAEMLNRLIRERPNNVGTALRNWMATSES